MKTLKILTTLSISLFFLISCNSGISESNLKGTTWSSKDGEVSLFFKTKTLVMFNGKQAGEYKVEDNIVIVGNGLVKIPLTYEDGKLSGNLIMYPKTKMVTLYKLNEEKAIEKEQITEPKIDKEFITLNSIKIGDNIAQHSNYKLDDKQDNFFDVYINKEKTTINKLEGNLKLYVSNSIVEKIEFNSADSFMGSTSLAGTAFNIMLEERKSWVRDAMLNYNITEWDDSKKIAQYVKQDFIHQYDLEKIEMLGVQLGWNMSYIITSKNAEIKEEQGKKNNLDFGSTKVKDEVEKNIIPETNNQDIKEELKDNSNQKIKKTLIVNVDNLRVRVSPDLNSDKIENLPLNTEVEYLNEKSAKKTTVKINESDINDYWYKIRTPNGNIGWIHGCCFNMQFEEIELKHQKYR